MPIPRLLSSPALALAAALAAAVFAFGAPPASADAIDDQIKAMKEFEKSGDEGKCIGKMQELKDSGDPRVIAAIKDLKSSKKDKIACSAIRIVSNRKDAELLKWLHRQADDKDLADAEDGRPDVYKCVLEAIGAYGEKSSLKVLEGVVKKYMPTNSEYATRAIASFGKVRQIAVVDQLVEWMELADSSAAGQGGKSPSAETRENKQKAGAACVDALRALTGQDIGDAVTWKKWWADHRKGFKFPDPSKPEAAMPPLDPKQKVFSDAAYNYAMRLPQPDAGWMWKERESWNRVTLTNFDESNMEWGRIEIAIHNTTSMSPKDIQALGEWYRDKGFPEDFSEFSPTGAPKLEEKKFSGRPWLLASAKGQAKGNKVNWGSMERRVYMTKCDYMGSPHLILVVHLTCRNGMEDELKKKLYDAVESMEIKVSK